LARVAAAALLLPPLLAVPLFVLGGRIANGLDDDASNGVFALDLLLGIAGPVVLAALLAYRRAGIPIAVVLGIASGLISVAVLFVAFLVYCDTRDCIV
jgi:hypothetical protein